MSLFYFVNNPVSNKPILIIFGTWNLEKTSHQQIYLSTSHVKCSHCTLRNTDCFCLIEDGYALPSIHANTEKCVQCG